MTNDTEQEKGLIDLMAEKQIEGTIEEYISTYLPKEKLIEIGTEIICKYILTEFNDNPNVFIELGKGAWGISYNNKYGFIVAKGKVPGFRYIAYLLRHENQKFTPMQLENQFKDPINDKTSTGQYDKEEGNNVDSGTIGDKLDLEAQKEFRLEYKRINDALGENEILDDKDPEKIVFLKKIQAKKKKFEETFLKTYGGHVNYLLGKHSNIHKDESKGPATSKRMVARHIKNALNLIGEDPNISHLKDYLGNTIKGGHKLVYAHDRNKPSWNVILK